MEPVNDQIFNDQILLLRHRRQANSQGTLRHRRPPSSQEIGVLRETATIRRRLIKVGSVCCAPVTFVPSSLAATCITVYWACGGNRFNKLPCDPPYKTKCSLVFCSVLHTYQCCEGGKDTLYLLPDERQRLGLPVEAQRVELPDGRQIMQ